MRVAKLKSGWRANRCDSEPGLCVLAGISAQAARYENDGTTNFRNIGERIANNTASYCNMAVRSANVAMDGAARHDRIEVMTVKVRSSMLHKSDGKYVLCAVTKNRVVLNVCVKWLRQIHCLRSLQIKGMENNR